MFQESHFRQTRSTVCRKCTAWACHSWMTASGLQPIVSSREYKWKEKAGIGPEICKEVALERLVQIWRHKNSYPNDWKGWLCTNFWPKVRIPSRRHTCWLLVVPGIFVERQGWGYCILHVQSSTIWTSNSSMCIYQVAQATSKEMEKQKVKRMITHWGPNPNRVCYWWSQTLSLGRRSQDFHWT